MSNYYRERVGKLTFRALALSLLGFMRVEKSFAIEGIW